MGTDARMHPVELLRRRTPPPGAAARTAHASIPVFRAPRRPTRPSRYTSCRSVAMILAAIALLPSIGVASAAGHGPRASCPPPPYHGSEDFMMKWGFYSVTMTGGVHASLTDNNHVSATNVPCQRHVFAKNRPKSSKPA